MMNDALGKFPKMLLFMLYDKIETHLNSLNVLNASRENYSSILHLLIKSCLLVDFLKLLQETGV